MGEMKTAKYSIRVRLSVQGYKSPYCPNKLSGCPIMLEATFGSRLLTYSRFYSMQGCRNKQLRRCRRTNGSFPIGDTPPSNTIVIAHAA